MYVQFPYTSNAPPSTHFYIPVIFQIRLSSSQIIPKNFLPEIHTHIYVSSTSFITSSHFLPNPSHIPVPTSILVASQIQMTSIQRYLLPIRIPSQTFALIRVPKYCQFVVFLSLHIHISSILHQISI